MSDRYRPGPTQRGGGHQGGGGAGRASGGDTGLSEVENELRSAETLSLWSGERSARKLRPELLDAEAQSEARKMAVAEVKTTQLRRFYGPVVALRQRLQADREISDSEVQVQVAHLKASAAYAGARKQPKEIVRFFVRASNAVKDREDFLAFARHFEAVMAYHKVFSKDGGNSR